jgi:hypothetical protein
MYKYIKEEYIPPRRRRKARKGKHMNERGIRDIPLTLTTPVLSCPTFPSEVSKRSYRHIPKPIF